MESQKYLTVKAACNSIIKRFDVPDNSTFADLLEHIVHLFGSGAYAVKFKDEDDDIITISREEEYTEALKSVPKTGMILRLFLTKSYESLDKFTENVSANLAIPVKAKSTEAVISDKAIKTKKTKLSTSESYFDEGSTDCRKRTVPHKIQSASKLSQDVKFSTSEVTGRIPVLAPASEQCLEMHFISQKPGCRKVRRLSSNTGSDKNDRKSLRNKLERKKKRKHQSSSSSSYGSSDSSSSSISSSSESSSEDNLDHDGKGKKKKSRVILNEMMHKFEKQVERQVSKDLERYAEVMKKDITSSVTHSVIEQLEGAVIQSIRSGPSTETSTIPTPTSGNEENSSSRLRYHHQNVVCDNCDNEIFGPRYKCGNCSDYDLCENCEMIEGIHTPSHVFLKIHYPSVCAGRKTVGGKLRPLLRASIYEEREKEREKEDLLQRKFDSGSEMSVKAMEKQRIKMREAERSREVREARREEWKRMKKEMKVNRKEQAKKLRQAIQQMRIDKKEPENNVVDQLINSNKDFAFEITNTPDAFQQSPSTEYLGSPDLSDALIGLQIVQNSQQQCRDEEHNKDHVTSDNESDMNQVVEASQFSEQPYSVEYDSDRTSNDVIIVKKSDLPEEMKIVDSRRINSKPDLVDFVRDMNDQSMNEDFVVVPKCFDLNSPLNMEEIGSHHQHDGECCSGICFLQASGSSFPSVDLPEQYEIYEHPVEERSMEDIPVDLVASVPTNSRSQPDIASFECESNIMDQDIEESLTSSPVITPEPVSLDTCLPYLHSDEASSQDEMPDPTMQFSFHDSPVVEQPKQAQSEAVVLTQPTLHDEIISLKQSLDSVLTPPVKEENKTKTLLELAHVPSVERFDSVKQSQIERENQLKRKEEQIKLLEMERKQEEEEEEKNKVNEPVSPSRMSLFNPPSSKFLKQLEEQRVEQPKTPKKVKEQEKNVTFGDVITDAVATLVDVAASAANAVANVVSPKETPTVEYRNGEDEITVECPPLPQSPPAIPAPCPAPPTCPYQPGDNNAMKTLLDMGFFDRSLNERLLTKHNGNVATVVGELLHINDNSWHQTRH